MEGQSLLLVEEDEISDEQKPLYAGHIVAVIERVAGQMFSGTLGLLRPSSQATKEKQEAERAARDGGHGRQHDRQQDKPKIVWFKPTDKRDNNFAADEFSEAVLKNVGWEDWTVASEGDALLTTRRDLRDETTFTIDPTGTKEFNDAIHIKKFGDGKVEIGIHVADVAHFVKANSLVDREAKKRGTGVHLMTRVVNMLPPRLSNEICSLLPGQERLTVSVIFQVDTATGAVDDDVWIGKSVIKSSGKLSYDDVNAAIKGEAGSLLEGVTADDIRLLGVSTHDSYYLTNLNAK